METAVIILGIALILVCVVLLWSKNRSDSHAANRQNEEQIRILKEMLQAQAQESRRIIEQQSEQARRSVESQIESLNKINSATATLREEQHAAQIEEIRRKYDDELNRIREESRIREEQVRRESEERFKALSQAVLEENAQSLKTNNSESIESILNPLREQIEGFRKLVSDSYGAENASRKSLTDQIDRLVQLNQTIGEEAHNLTSALKGNSKVQGDWGEVLLETLLENAGLKKGIHFESQVTRDADGAVLTDDEGRRQRPDVIINLPDSHRMVIDSKVSLTDFVEYCNTDSSDERNLYGKKHLLSVRKHIDELGNKMYQSTIRNAAEHVLMFIPNENAYLLALELDSNLWRYAYEHHVALVSPTHLFSVMQIISQLWTQDDRNRNAYEIARIGGRLYDKFVKFADEFAKIEKALMQAQNACSAASKVMTTGNGNIVRSAEQLRELGAKTTKSLPTALTDSADD